MTNHLSNGMAQCLNILGLKLSVPLTLLMLRVVSKTRKSDAHFIVGVSSEGWRIATK